MKNILLLCFLILASIIILPIKVSARQGCCSSHGGVCGCSCCDGSALSATCAPYYPNCNQQPVYTQPTPTPAPPPAIQPEPTTPSTQKIETTVTTKTDSSVKGINTYSETQTSRSSNSNDWIYILGGGGLLIWLVTRKKKK